MFAGGTPVRRWGGYALLWMLGASTRVTLLAVVPVLPGIVEEFALSVSGVGMLSTLPLLLFAVCAFGGAMLVGRFGHGATLAWGLVAVATGACARAWATDWAGLMMATAWMGLGIAVIQPAVAVAIRAWIPTRPAFAMAVYANGLIVWEILPMVLIPGGMLEAVNGDWRTIVILWSLPVFATLIGLAVLMRTEPRGVAGPASHTPESSPTPASPISPAAARCRPVRRRWPGASLWWLGLAFGSVSSGFFLTNAFLPLYLTATDRASEIGMALTVFNGAQLPASLFMLRFAARLAPRRMSLVWAGVACAACVGVLGWGPGVGFLPALGVFGFLCAASLILGLAQPGQLARADRLRHVAASMFAIGYGLAFVVGVAGGHLYDLWPRPALLFAPIAAVMILQAVAAARIRPEL